LKTVFIPFSDRSFSGICRDVLRHCPDVEIIAMVLEGESAPGDMRHVMVSRMGVPDPIDFEVLEVPIVIANGGPTPLGVGAVLLSQRLSCPLWNIQRDGVILMESH